MRPGLAAAATRRRARGRAAPACPLCSAPSAGAWAPFCSPRCADRDLANWLGGKYAIPADDDGDGVEDEAAAGPDDPGRARP